MKKNVGSADRAIRVVAGMSKHKHIEIEVSVAEVMDYLRLSGQFSTVFSEVVQRKITADEAKKNGIEISEDELQKAADTFRIANGMNKASETQEWLSSNGISLEVLEDFLETNLLINKMKDKLANDGDKEKYISSEAIQESIRQMIYEDWLDEKLK